MKKILALTLALVLCLGFVACGGKTEPTVPAPDDDVTEPEGVVYPEGVSNLIIEGDNKSFDYNGYTFTSARYEIVKSGENEYAEDVTLADQMPELALWKADGDFQALIDVGKCTGEIPFRDAEAILYGFENYDEMLRFEENVFAIMDTDASLNAAE